MGRSLSPSQFRYNSMRKAVRCTHIELPGGELARPRRFAVWQNMQVALRVERLPAAAAAIEAFGRRSLARATAVAGSFCAGTSGRAVLLPGRWQAPGPSGLRMGRPRQGPAERSRVGTDRGVPHRRSPRGANPRPVPAGRAGAGVLAAAAAGVASRALGTLLTVYNATKQGLGTPEGLIARRTPGSRNLVCSWCVRLSAVHVTSLEVPPRPRRIRPYN